MKRILTILAVLVLSIPTYAQLLWPIKGADAGSNIISRPQHYVDRELNFDELFIAADEGIEVISLSDGTIVSFGINYLHNLSTSTSYSVESSFDQAILEVKAKADLSKINIGITDDLYLMRDGYTFPIKCREDLIHHGYILR